MYTNLIFNRLKKWKKWSQALNNGHEKIILKSRFENQIVRDSIQEH